MQDNLIENILINLKNFLNESVTYIQSSSIVCYIPTEFDNSYYQLVKKNTLSESDNVTMFKHKEYKLKSFRTSVAVEYLLYNDSPSTDNSFLVKTIANTLSTSVLKEAVLNESNEKNILIVSGTEVVRDDYSLSLIFTLRALLLINKKSLTNLCKRCAKCDRKISCLLNMEKNCFLVNLYKMYNEIHSNR